LNPSANDSNAELENPILYIPKSRLEHVSPPIDDLDAARTDLAPSDHVDEIRLGLSLPGNPPMDAFSWQATSTFRMISARTFKLSVPARDSANLKE
jgi:hypothetical protein